MPLSLKPPLEPMEARLVESVPLGEEWQYEPKWDGFRCLAFRDGGDVQLVSKSGQPLGRYFPDVVAALRGLKAKQFVLDGEIVIPVDGRLSFDELLLRVHPAESRVRKLAAEHPAIYILFDLLADIRDRSLLEKPLSERRVALENFASRLPKTTSAKPKARKDAAHAIKPAEIRLSPATQDVKVARKWFKDLGGNLDGIIAKRRDLTYQAGNRDGMQKIKHARTADCVVGGFRYAEGKPVIGSLLLGLYDGEGKLNHVGFTSSFKTAERKRITEMVEPLIEPPGFTGRAPGGPSRWSTRRTDEWKPLRPELVIEVEYDHFTGDRFRHGTKLLRWRPDKAPEQCTLDQVAARGGKTLALLER